MRLTVLASLALISVTANAATNHKTVPLKAKAPSEKSASVRSSETVTRAARQTNNLTEITLSGSVSHLRSTYNPWSCEASWDENCEATGVLQAEEGYQACRLEVRVTTSDGHDAWFNSSPTNWYASDPLSPDRFHGFQVTIHAFGNGNYFDHRGSKEVVEMTLDEIPASADNFTRFAEGCTMPAHD